MPSDREQTPRRRGPPSFRRWTAIPSPDPGEIPPLRFPRGRAFLPFSSIVPAPRRVVRKRDGTGGNAVPIRNISPHLFPVHVGNVVVDRQIRLPSRKGPKVARNAAPPSPSASGIVTRPSCSRKGTLTNGSSIIQRASAATSESIRSASAARSSITTWRTSAIRVAAWFTSASSDPSKRRSTKRASRLAARRASRLNPTLGPSTARTNTTARENLLRLCPILAMLLPPSDPDGNQCRSGLTSPLTSSLRFSGACWFFCT